MKTLNQYFQNPEVLTKIITEALKEIQSNKRDRENPRKLARLELLNTYAKKLIIQQNEKDL